MSPNDSDDLEDLDYGDDDFDLESKTELSQNSGARTSNQDVGEDDEEGAGEHEGGEGGVPQFIDDDKFADAMHGDANERDNSDLRTTLLLRRYVETRGQKRKHDEVDEEQDCDRSRNSDKRTIERCKYWPQCLAKDECSFYHPTKRCRAFPKCTFGDTCLFVHPTCRFFPLCTKTDCPYAHPQQPKSGPQGRGAPAASRLQAPMAPQFRPQPMQPAVPKCKFGFKCVNLMCKFSHQASEPCRYGSNCLLENCAFTHPTDQQAQQQQNKSSNVFKWTAKS